MSDSNEENIEKIYGSAKRIERTVKDIAGGDFTVPAEIEDIARLLKKIDRKVDRLSDRVDELFELQKKGGALAEPEAILTCVQCTAEFKNSENAEGSCHYHKKSTVSQGWNHVYPCCQQKVGKFDDPGTPCTKGKHRAAHHTEYTYAAYTAYLRSIKDDIDETWGLLFRRSVYLECGKMKDGNLYSMAGTPRGGPECFNVISQKEFHKGGEGKALKFEKNDIVSSVTPTHSGFELSIKVEDETSVQTVDVDRHTLECLGRSGANVNDEASLPTKEELFPVTPMVELSHTSSGPFIDNSEPPKIPESIEPKTNSTAATIKTVSAPVCVQSRLDEGCLSTFSVHLQGRASDPNVFITDVGVEMETPNGWVKADKAILDRSMCRGYWDQDPMDTQIAIKEGEITSFVTVWMMKTTDRPGSNYNARNRAPASLAGTKEVVCRLTFTVVEGDTQPTHLPMDIDFVNPQAHITTQENAQKNVGEKFALFASVDDLVDIERYSVAIAPASNKIILVTRYDGSTSYNITGSTLKAICEDAKKEKTPHFLLKDYSKDNKYLKSSVYAEVDFDHSIVKGFIVEMECGESKCHASTPLPLIKATTEIDITSVDRKSLKCNIKPSSWAEFHWVCLFKKNEVDCRKSVGSAAIRPKKDQTILSDIEIAFDKSAAPGDYELRFFADQSSGSLWRFEMPSFVKPFTL